MNDPRVFDPNGINSGDDESSHAGTRRIWEIAVTRMWGTVPEIEQPEPP